MPIVVSHRPGRRRDRGLASRPATWDQDALDVGGDLKVLAGGDDQDTDSVVVVGIVSADVGIRFGDAVELVVDPYP